MEHVLRPAIAAAALAAGCAATPMDAEPVATAADNTTPAAAAAAPDGPGRDWSAIDVDRDGLVSPTEMERWLAANPGPQR